MASSDIIGKKYLRAQAFVTGAAFLASAAILRYSPGIPFDPELPGLLAAASAGYFLFAAAWRLISRDLHAAILSLSLYGTAVMGFVLHMTGGIASPLVCFYFALLVSEVGYGVTSRLSLFAAMASYVCVVAGEWAGALRVADPRALALYSSPAAALFISGSVLSFMALTGSVGKLILGALRADFADEQFQRRALQEKFAELSSSAQIGTLTHRIVHDLRAPLGAIMGYGELLLRSASRTEGEKEILGDLLGAVDKMDGTLRDVVRFGRAQTAPREQLRLAGLLRNLVTMAKLLPDCGKNTIEESYSGCEELEVLASGQELRQAYFNVLKNALEALAGQPRDRKVRVVLRAAGGFAEADIEHNGPPIPPEVLASLFKKPVTGRAGGTGVGMLIAQDLLARNGGKICAENLAQGVRISTRLPLAAAKAPLPAAV